MFVLKKIDYSFDALEPFFDKKTMEIHHTKHHQSYVNNLNKALEKYDEWKNKDLETLLKSLHLLPKEIQTAVRNNGGGVYNHDFYFKILAKNKKNINEQLLEKIKNDFGSLDNLKATFYTAALSNFGSGWTWLCLDKNKLKVINTSGHDCVITNDLKPLICIDIWEHAYYLKFQNKRNEYIETFWELINWDLVSDLFLSY